jgi:hypothetical protein
MPKKAGKITIIEEENTMTANLTLNDLTIEQASALLTLLDEMQTAEKAKNALAAQEGVPLFEEPAPAAVQAAAPVQPAPVPTTTPAPVQPAPIPVAIPAAIPAQTYTVQQLGQAARPLVEQGRQQELIALLAEFGVQSVAALPENRRADFAARLRAMGGLI